MEFVKLAQVPNSYGAFEFVLKSGGVERRIPATTEGECAEETVSKAWKDRDYRLAKTLSAVKIHGITGQDLEEGLLEQGDLVCKIQEEEDVDLGRVFYFNSSSDGKNWYRYRSYESPMIVGA